MSTSAGAGQVVRGKHRRQDHLTRPRHNTDHRGAAARGPTAKSRLRHPGLQAVPAQPRGIIRCKCTWFGFRQACLRVRRHQSLETAIFVISLTLIKGKPVSAADL